MGLVKREGSLAYSSLLSVIEQGSSAGFPRHEQVLLETCRLRQVNPWKYISSVIKLASIGRSSAPTASRYLNLNGHPKPV